MKLLATKKKVAILLILATLIAATTLFVQPQTYSPIPFPEAKDFAFTIVDDTDGATVQNVKPVYDYLYELGLRTTKTVWALPNYEAEEWCDRGQSLSDSDYVAFILDLQEKGFEIASHGVRGGSTKRPEILEGYKKFREIIGHYPNIHINHYRNKDNLYWGVNRFHLFPLKILYGLYQWVTGCAENFGHVRESEYFWGDLAQAHVTYVVNFSFHEINLLKVNPSMPYYEPERPYVNYWFHTSDGGDVNSFNQLLTKKNLDRLENEGGVCIVYTHFAKGFCPDGVLNSTTMERLQDLASRNGWFAPASEILDYLRHNRKNKERLNFRERVYLELRFVWERLLHGPS